jgi:hypothetical protein
MTKRLKKRQGAKRELSLQLWQPCDSVRAALLAAQMKHHTQEAEAGTGQSPQLGLRAQCSKRAVREVALPDLVTDPSTYKQPPPAEAHHPDNASRG